MRTGPHLRTLSVLIAASLCFGAARAGAQDPLAAYAQAIEQNPTDAKSYDAYAKAAFAAQKFDEAIARLKVGIARCNDFTDGFYLLAYAYRKKNAWADAAVFYRISIALKHKENDSYFGLGKALASLGDAGGAVTALRKYVTQEKRLPQMQKFIDEANAEIARLEPQRSAPAPAGGEAGRLRAEADQLRLEKRLEEAAAAYRRAIEADRNNLDLYNDLGNVYFALNRYDDAVKSFKESTSRDPNYVTGLYNLASALRKGKRYAEAVDVYRRYMKIKPDNPDPYYGVAQTLKSLGDTGEAVKAFRRYIEMEKRPSEQKWVEKARQELGALETPAPTFQPSGKVSDDK